ncbi:MAG: Na+/H+ antiporter subunit B [Caldilinea sp. CFX5]|nr:Na+/H+ antiporter subunit B [Caldilinea sp. CFX5]
MNSLILSVAGRYLLPLLLLFSLFLLFRGHNEPGGGFVGGLVAASAFALYALAFDVNAARRLLRLEPRVLIALGLTVAGVSGFGGLLTGRPFFAPVWGAQELPIIGKPGTPLFFDTGVYLTVIGITTLILFSLAEE